MKTIVLLIGCACMMVLPSMAQIIVWEEDFEDHGNSANGGSGRYTSVNDFHEGPGGDDNYFGRVEGSTKEYYLTNSSSGFLISSNVAYTNWNGNFFYAAEDLDDLGGTIGNPDGIDFKDLTISGINISNAFGLNFTGLFAAGENSGCANSVYDDADFVEVYYEVDGGGEVLALCFNADLECNIPADITNEPLYHDSSTSQGGACDGDGGGGTLLTANFAEFNFIIPDGSNLDLRIRVSMDSGDEEFAFDQFVIEAEILGISDTNLTESVSIIPNPSNGIFELKKSDGLELDRASIYSIMGERLKTIDLRAMADKKILDLTNLSSGLYFITINHLEGGAVTKKVIID